jgi:small GTP-binding protein
MALQMKCKVILIGDYAVGKTSLIQRFVFDVFRDTYLTTIGVKVTKKDVTVALAKENAEVSLLLWDIAGDDGFSKISPDYMRGAAGGIIVSDVTRPETVRNMQHHVASMRTVCPDAEFVFALNKSDAADSGSIRIDDMVSQFADSMPSVHDKCFVTSAKENSNVDALFTHLASQVFHRVNL